MEEIQIALVFKNMKLLLTFMEEIIKQGLDAMQTIMFEPKVLLPILEIGDIINDHANAPMHKRIVEEAIG